MSGSCVSIAGRSETPRQNSGQNPKATPTHNGYSNVGPHFSANKPMHFAAARQATPKYNRRQLEKPQRPKIAESSHTTRCHVGPIMPAWVGAISVT